MTVGRVVRDIPSAAFFDGTAAGTFLLPTCPEGHASEPAAQQCLTCGRTDLTGVAAGGGASVVSWSVTHERARGDLPARRNVVVVAQLDEGPWWWSQITDADPDTIEVGTRLRLDFEACEGFETVPVFRLDATHDEGGAR